MCDDVAIPALAVLDQTDQASNEDEHADDVEIPEVLLIGEALALLGRVATDAGVEDGAGDDEEEEEDELKAEAAHDHGFARVDAVTALGEEAAAWDWKLDYETP